MPRFLDIRRALPAVAAALAGLLVAGAAGAEWTTNTASLDNGMCGHNLQIGSNVTASSSATPTFLLEGDGGASSYSVLIDGKALGTFGSDGHAVVCIRTGSPLAQGKHLMTATELAPIAGSVVRLGFSVDTVPPTAPSRPVLSAYSDSGVRGDRITSFQTVNLTGTAGPHQSVQLIANGGPGVAGATADAKGRWSATTVPLTPGTYRITAVSLDSAGNHSPPSAVLRLTIRP